MIVADGIGGFGWFEDCVSGVMEISKIYYIDVSFDERFTQFDTAITILRRENKATCWRPPEVILLRPSEDCG